MTELSSRNISPDGITGMILALDGIKNTVVLLNGPMGCKFYHSTTSQFLTVRPPMYLPSEDGSGRTPVNYNFLNKWFFRQSRVPCTYLDGEDYVYGTTEKVREALLYLKEQVAFDLLAVVNSPGASLIGDHLAETAAEVLPETKTIVLESPGYSTGFAFGYETAFRNLAEQLTLPAPTEKRSRKRVNLLGLSLWQRYWIGDIEELKRLFELCNIEVGCCVFAENTVEELAMLRDADLNVVLYPEMASDTARYLKERYGVPYYLCPVLPVGFFAVEQIFSEIAGLLGEDAGPLMEESERSRAFAWSKLDSFHQLCGLPNGALYAIEGTASQVISYAKFFSEYLGMIPETLEVTDGMDGQKREALLKLSEQYGIDGKVKTEMLQSRADLVFGEANTIAALKLGSHPFTGIEISQPGMGYIDLIPKTQMGIRGTLFLIEQVLNGLQAI
ncbi:MAG: nitrogenase component 1 [Eubacteriales bacterium]|nr:nitrogenase component 1 [Eubacteriales bacterium]